ncbi:MAG: leucine-rich repeat protein [Ruminococcus sp.]|nr:leucine-rich repeat protein [Ruminococcus sp.]
MIKKTTAALTALMMIFTFLCPMKVFADPTYIENFEEYYVCVPEDYVIEDGEVIEYIGDDCYVIVPDGVTAIGKNAFYNKQLSGVYLPDTVTYIGENAFKSSSLFEIRLSERLRYIGDSAFAYTNLYELEIPDSVKTIPYDAFYYSTLQKVKLPASLETIQHYAFFGTNIQEFEFPDSLTYAAYSSFLYTPFLQNLADGNGGWLILSNGLLVLYTGNDVNVVMPDTVTEIGESAFYNRSRLHSLSIPDSVKKIDGSPFSVYSPDIIYSTNPLAKELGVKCIEYQLPPAVSHPALDLSADIWQFGNDKAVFGESYTMTEAARSKLTLNIRKLYQDFDEAWGGSCYGMVLTVLLAKSGLLSPDRLQSGAASLHDITPDEDILSIINYYQYLQYTDAAITVERHPGVAGDEFFDHVIDLAWQAENNGIPFLLTFDTMSGGHTCAGCGIESGQWEWDGSSYDRRIIIWDPNFPESYNDECYIYFRNSDYDYCIPMYGVQYSLVSYSSTGKIKAASDALDILSKPEYPNSNSSFEQGDVNGDGYFNIADMVLLQKWLLSLPDSRIPNWEAADICEDGRLDGFDLCMMRQLLLQIN